MNAKIVLVGLGPHAKRIYMNCFNRNNVQPKLIIDLESKCDEILEYVKTNKLSTETFFIKDEYKNSDRFSEDDEKELNDLIEKLGITHAIISTEPKAHYLYICYFLRKNIHVLTDKPLTAPVNVSTDINMAKKIIEEYNDIKELYDDAKDKGTILQVQCQRRWHKGYRFIHNLASEIVKKYRVPITSIQMSHCDGMWNMPSEFITRENHPYKYGYGKLFHSGYHFIDLVSWFESINDVLGEKKANNAELYAAEVRPSDFMTIIDKDNYHRLLNTKKFDEIFDNIDDYHFEQYGEIDLYSTIQFKRDDKVITTVNLNLMQNGFSRRSWDDLPVDTYKGNGRVRHEYMNIEIGPLMNIQIHSYQAKEIKDRIEGETCVGEVEHFDVYVFRNVDLIGGQPMEKFTLQDIFQNQEQMRGYNENARENCFKEFINEKVTGNPLEEHKLGILLLYKAYESLCNRYEGGQKCINFSI